MGTKSSFRWFPQIWKSFQNLHCSYLQFIHLYVYNLAYTRDAFLSFFLFPLELLSDIIFAIRDFEQAINLLNKTQL